ncbi:MAG: HNH endonuclease [Candidatus Thorarchaeota archaeon]|jgi:hypothetical protein
MFADEDHFQWQYWVETGVMSIGWGQRTKTKNVEGINDWEELSEAFRPHYETNRRARFAARQLWRFVVEAKNNDIICVYDEGSILGIGTITGDCEYIDDDEWFDNGWLFAYRRDVDWLTTHRRRLIPKQMKHLQKLSQGSIYRVEDQDMIEQIIQWANSDTLSNEDLSGILDDLDYFDEDDGPDVDDRLSAGTRRRRSQIRAKRFLLANNESCQICGQSIGLPDGSHYVEVHHIHPMGRPHKGPDRMANMLCLCPNHHVEMDKGAFYINAKRRVVHFDSKSPIQGKKVKSIRKNWPSSQYLKYHYEVTCRNWATKAF